MDIYDTAAYTFEGGLGALYYELSHFARVAGMSIEHDEYFHSIACLRL